MNLLKFSGLENGEVVCDPMCGGGGIPIEAAYEWPGAVVIAGDNHEQAFQRAVDNIRFNNDKLEMRMKADVEGVCQAEGDVKKNSTAGFQHRRPLAIDVFRWDVTALPLRSESVDVFVTDLPFGKRSGTKSENRLLYPQLLNQLARVAKRESGRAVFLTEDKNGFFKAMEANQSLWWKKRHLWINIGGMWGGVFLLARNERPWKPLAPSKNSIKQSAKKKRKIEAAAADAAEANGAVHAADAAEEANGAAHAAANPNADVT